MKLIDCPRVEVLDNVISETDCEDIIKFATPKLHRSVVIGRRIIPGRSSSDATIHYQECTAAASVIDAVAKIFNVSVDCCEPLNAIRYNSGEYYRPHVDYGHAIENRRIATAIVYLNDVSSGGETIFPKLRKAIKPKRGKILYFRYDYPDEEINKSTLHGGRPPVDGETKWIATVWVHEKPYKRIMMKELYYDERRLSMGREVSPTQD